MAGFHCNYGIRFTSKDRSHCPEMSMAWCEMDIHRSNSEEMSEALSKWMFGVIGKVPEQKPRAMTAEL